jgi:hypothetical protein
MLSLKTGDQPFDDGVDGGSVNTRRIFAYLGRGSLHAR